MANWIIFGETAVLVGSSSFSGTGLVHMTSGNLDGGAWPFEDGASADQLLVTNHAGTDVTAITPAGDTTYANGSFTNVAIRGQSVAAGTAANQLWQYNGTSWAVVSTSSIITYPAPSGGSCSISFSSTIPSSLNISTSSLATRDWFAPGGTGNIAYRANVTNHFKSSGSGQLKYTFDFVGYASQDISVFTGDGALYLTSTAADDGWQTPMNGSSNSVQCCIDGSNAALGWGYRFTAPADTYQRTLTIYGGQYSCTVTCTVTASDGSFTTQTLSQDVSANTGQNNAWTIGPYSTARDGQFITVTVLCTVNHGGSPNIAFSCSMLK